MLCEAYCSAFSFLLKMHGFMLASDICVVFPLQYSCENDLCRSITKRGSRGKSIRIVDISESDVEVCWLGVC